MQLSHKFDDALLVATRLHTNQKRKGTNIPYVSHLLAVSAIVLENGGNEDEAIAALLHDAVEDQGGAPVLKQIRNQFGDNVADIVDACSEKDIVPKPPWRVRKQRYIDEIAHMSRSALFVAIADKLHNVRTIMSEYRQCGDEIWKRFNAGKDDQIWCFNALAEAFMMVEEGPLAMEYFESVCELILMCDENERP